MTGDGTCALWYMRHGGLDYEICDTEAEAIRAAFGMLETGEAAPSGVQFPDGRVVRRRDWVALLDYRDAVYAAEHAALAARPAPVKPAKRDVRSPFGDTIVTVDVGEPEWLGRPL